MQSAGTILGQNGVGKMRVDCGVLYVVAPDVVTSSGLVGLQAKTDYIGTET